MEPSEKQLDLEAARYELLELADSLDGAGLPALTQPELASAIRRAFLPRATKAELARR